MKPCLEGLSLLSSLIPQASKPLRGHMSIIVDTKGLINGLANTVLKAELHHTNLISQKRTHADYSILPSCLLWASEGDNIKMDNKSGLCLAKKEKKMWRKAEQRKMPRNQKAACHE